uniref:Uncharacterized protein n=1 Tax=Arundo donax TaxID=35708 RepID=A0A0A9NZY5_ARUDO
MPPLPAGMGIGSKDPQYEFQFRLIIPTMRPIGRLETEAADDPAVDCVELVFRGASSALLGTRWTSSSSSSSSSSAINDFDSCH